MSDTDQSGIFNIRNLTFDPQMRTLHVNGRRTILDARSSAVFAALAERFGDCVSKEALMRAGWPAQVVHENSLAKAISKLRPAISGSGIEIAAVYGLGYSLRTLEKDEPAAPPLHHEAAVAATTSSRVRHGAFPAFALVLALVAALAAYLVIGRSGQASFARDAPPITNDAPNAVATVLWVDDHPSNNSREVEALKQRHVAVHLAESTDDALKLLAMNRYNLVVSDLGRGDDRLAGLRLIDAMKRQRTAVPVIIYTVRPPDRPKQDAQRRLVAEGGAADLAVTPEEVRAKILRRLQLQS